MERFITCIAHNSSECNLIIGSEAAALFDCGMLFCADSTIDMVKKNLNGRHLDYIIASHTHYDHIGALPFFREAWSEMKLITSQPGAAVLLKDTPRRVIRELSHTAALLHGINQEFVYDDSVFTADSTVSQDDSISLGDITVKILETPGHTRDSLSFFIPELELLILNETLGVLLPGGEMYPCYLTSCRDAINSIEKCRAIPHKYLCLPHKTRTSK